MSRQYWKPSNLLNPLPVVLVTSIDKEGKANVMTAAWAGTVCSDPVMVSISIRKERYSHKLIMDSNEFVVCLTNRKLAKVTDYVGVKSGRDIDKFSLEGELKLTKISSQNVKAPSIEESPVCLECKVKHVIELGSHDMFIGEVVGTNIDDTYLDKNNRLNLRKADLIAYSHGQYYTLDKVLGKFGYSVQKKIKKRKKQ
ncbi:MAG: flavin reductase family protein [Solobacterium sp.]|nr:flavin reductase family protein [Solobacterium sp.]